ncbi:MAG: DUF1127 domain-containing protein [Sedimenticola sp.]|nr:DUF1127 domain-containing protein [Sedimenticola sp.]
MKSELCVNRPITTLPGEQKLRLSRAFYLIQSLVIQAMEKVHHWQMISRQRSELRGLSDAMLKDIGISRADAEGEAFRHFWDDKRFNRRF